MAELMHEEGFAYGFDAKACETCQGNCCTGESGYIWVSQEERKAMAEYLKMSEEEFIKEYLLKIRYRFTLKEMPYENGFSCIFFDKEHKRCGIYAVRPSQCRTFPFWDYFKENIDEVVTECPGIIRF